MIVGAGLAGLVAAHAFPAHTLIERSPEPREAHLALLRFRSAAIGHITGIEFRPVTVRKGIFDLDRMEPVGPSIATANRYAMKVIGRIVDRSIWNLEPCQRYIAPMDFYGRMLEQVRHRIEFGVAFDYTASRKAEPIISTAPMPIALESAGIKTSVKFERSPIFVRRFRIEKCDVYQTVYFVGSRSKLYRASITGDLLICEFISEPEHNDVWASAITEAFGVPQLFDRAAPLDSITQRYGKIAPIPERERRALIGKLTEECGAFSLGRFATWRNILLDDLVQDMSIIRRLIEADSYTRRMAQA